MNNYYNNIYYYFSPSMAYTQAIGSNARALVSAQAGMKDDVQIRFMSGTTDNLPGTDIMGMIRSNQWKLEDIAKISFERDLRMVPYIQNDNQICADTFTILCALSEDFTKNNQDVNFWFVQHISTSAIWGVFRDSELASAFPSM